MGIGTEIFAPTPATAPTGAAGTTGITGVDLQNSLIQNSKLKTMSESLNQPLSV